MVRTSQDTTASEMFSSPTTEAKKGSNSNKETKKGSNSDKETHEHGHDHQHDHDHADHDHDHVDEASIPMAKRETRFGSLVETKNFFPQDSKAKMAHLHHQGSATQLARKSLAGHGHKGSQAASHRGTIVSGGHEGTKNMRATLVGTHQGPRKTLDRGGSKSTISSRATISASTTNVKRGTANNKGPLARPSAGRLHSKASIHTSRVSSSAITIKASTSIMEPHSQAAVTEDSGEHDSGFGKEPSFAVEIDTFREDHHHHGHEGGQGPGHSTHSDHDTSTHHHHHHHHHGHPDHESRRDSDSASFFDGKYEEFIHYRAGSGEEVYNTSHHGHGHGHHGHHEHGHHTITDNIDDFDLESEFSKGVGGTHHSHGAQSTVTIGDAQSSADSELDNVSKRNNRLHPLLSKQVEGEQTLLSHLNNPEHPFHHNHTNTPHHRRHHTHSHAHHGGHHQHHPGPRLRSNGMPLADEVYMPPTTMITESFDTYRDAKKRIVELNKKNLVENNQIVLFFLASRDRRGKIWHNECNIVDRAVSYISKKIQAGGYFLKIYVGDRAEWSELDNPWKKDPKYKVHILPTLMVLNTHKRLAGKKAFDMESIITLLQD